MMATKRRGHGEGTVYQRKDGRWAASLTLEGGKRKTFYGKTRKEVQEQLRVALHEQQQGTLATGPQQTLKHYLDHWLEEVYKPTIKESSYVLYRRMLDWHILPALGHIPVQRLTPQQIQSLYTRKPLFELSASMIRGIHGLLHMALENAVRWNLVGRNVCTVLSPPRQRRHEAQPLTAQQAKRLRETAPGTFGAQPDRDDDGHVFPPASIAATGCDGQAG